MIQKSLVILAFVSTCFSVFPLESKDKEDRREKSDDSNRQRKDDGDQGKRGWINREQTNRPRQVQQQPSPSNVQGDRDQPKRPRQVQQMPSPSDVQNVRRRTRPTSIEDKGKWTKPVRQVPSPVEDKGRRTRPAPVEEQSRGRWTKPIESKPIAPIEDKGKWTKPEQPKERSPLPKSQITEKKRVWDKKGKDYRGRFKDYKSSRHIFDNNYWTHFRARHRNWYFDNRFGTWDPAPWNQIVVWLPWRWNAPILYYYQDGDIYYSYNEDASDWIYYNPSSRISAIALANKDLFFSRNEADWIPLGTFGTISDDSQDQMPTEYFSLALSKNGAVSGAYFNTQTGAPMQIEGAVDEQSQRIAWKFVGNPFPVMETGLYNLTESESTFLIYNSETSVETGVIIKFDN